MFFRPVQRTNRSRYSHLYISQFHRGHHRVYLHFAGPIRILQLRIKRHGAGGESRERLHYWTWRVGAATPVYSHICARIYRHICTLTTAALSGNRIMWPDGVITFLSRLSRSCRRVRASHNGPGLLWRAHARSSARCNNPIIETSSLEQSLRN